MTNFASVPCYNVDCRNFQLIYPHLVDCIKNAYCIAVDLELSGIGGKVNSLNRDLDARYSHYCMLAGTRSILSIGLSIFKYTVESENKALDDTEKSPKSKISPFKLNVSTFDFYCKLQDEYITDFEALEFLQDHKFDFIRQKKFGISHTRDNFQCSDDPESSATLVNLFHTIARYKKPIIVHNGLLDLVFLFTFYSSLPKSVSSFSAYVKLLFPSGVYDTKYISVETNMESTYLEYVFYSQQRANLSLMRDGKRSVAIEFDKCDAVADGDSSPDDIFIIHRDLQTRIMSSGLTFETLSDICAHYAAYGWCSAGTSCKSFHNVDAILDGQLIEKLHKSKGKVKTIAKKIAKVRDLNDFAQKLTIQDSEEESDSKKDKKTSEQSNSSESFEIPLNGQSCVHKSGYDSFMTGFSFVTFANSLSLESKSSKPLSSYVNNLHIYQGSKFYIFKSDYAKISLPMQTKLKSIFD